ncbi:MAG: 2-amino-4-hydroxy-6-hydroxymethyldihydropteridine diphosphokinase [Candidatus Omnitrophota bacterium]|nr:2-amino-4-hydroxy-6-hydroxymethyldihydropteridine diphosphokinase [Candidatus Omnitrophota bacterium]
MATVYLGIGSNIGDKEENCREAVEKLAQIDDVRIERRSSLYITRPVEGPPQEDYINGAAGLRTELAPKDLLRTLKDIEKEMGRVPSEEKNSPRVIDIDILLYDDKIINADGLVIPHPRMHERYFVLRGLSEIAPETVHPILGKTISELFRGLESDVLE